ncbi:MAG: hypothetical protein ACI4RD_00260 [Kiritimatiellia bacterium]
MNLRELNVMGDTSNRFLAWVSAHRWPLGFTAVFAVLMAFVFWGAWSPDVSPVMPDDSVSHPLSFGTQWRGAVNGFLANGKFVPGDLLWNFPLVSKYWLQEFKYAFAAYCAALALAYFLRGRGLSPLAAYGAGLLLGFCGYWFSLFSAGHGGWFVWMTSGVFAFGLADRAVRYGQWRHWLLLGACVAWGSFYQPDLWLLFTLLTGAYTLAVCRWERRFPWRGMLVAALAFGIIGAPSFRDAFANSLAGRDQQIAEATAQCTTGAAADSAAKAAAEREARWIFVTNWSLPPGETAEFVIPRLNGDTSCPMTLQLGRAAGRDVRPYTGALGRPHGATAGNYRQHSLYVGWITCLLALCGVIASCSRLSADKCARRPVLFFACAAVLCWLLSLGRFCAPLYRLVFMLPFGDYLRAPVKWHHLTELCLCVLAGFGLEALLRFLSAKLGPRTALAAVGLAAVVGAADLARIDRLYCAPIDLTAVRGQNAAADCVLRSGKGKVADLIEGGRGLLAWGFQAHEVGVTGDPNEEGVRFVWVGTQQVAQNARLADYLKANADPVGFFAVTRHGVRSAAPDGANAALYQRRGVPPPPPKSPWRQPDPTALALGILSVLGTVAAGWIGLRGVVAGT